MCKRVNQYIVKYSLDGIEFTFKLNCKLLRTFQEVKERAVWKKNEFPLT